MVGFDATVSLKHLSCLLPGRDDLRPVDSRRTYTDLPVLSRQLNGQVLSMAAMAGFESNAVPGKSA